MTDEVKTDQHNDPSSKHYDTSHRESSSTVKKSSSTTSDYAVSTAVVGSSINGGSVAINAANDIKISGSEVVADKALTLAAGRERCGIVGREPGEGSTLSAAKPRTSI